MTYFIDTNIFLRVLVGDQKKQQGECIRVIQAIKENKIEAYTNTVVLAEVAWTLGSYYRFPKTQVIKGLKSIIHTSGLKILDFYDYFTSLSLYEKYNVKFIDTLIASSNDIINKKVIIISYDSDFDKLDVLRKEPKEIIEKSLL